LYDEINQKGFEGDTLLEGYAEFIRNLLICKDPKAARLLEVAEDFKSKYTQFAASTETAWLIAALNIISEAAISYKQARNKKLHIELAIIKLTYLSQAIQLSLNGEGLNKNKTIESVKSVSFKALSFISAPTVKKEIVVAKETKSAVLIIEEPTPIIKKAETKKILTPIIEAEKPTAKLGSLVKIRDRINEQNNKDVTVKEITIESLKEAWEIFTATLTNASNHSAATNFQLAELRVIDGNNFEIITESNIQQKFIEGEKTKLNAHLQQFFSNRLLKYQLIVAEKEIPVVTGASVMNRKEHFKLLTEQYPFIKDLKEKLKLEIE